MRICGLGLTVKQGLLCAGITAVIAAGYDARAENVVPATTVADTPDTSTDFLSDEAWRALPREERRARSRRNMTSRYEPSGQASVERLAQYVDKFAAFTVYDQRYYLYNVKTEHVTDTTGSVILSGEVFPFHYKAGVQDALESLGFNIVENRIQTLPAADYTSVYGVSTTSAATLRKEPRRNAEQLNSVGMGGWVRVLREATAQDVTAGSAGGRKAPGADKLSPDNPGDWYFVQTMEGYLGYSRKADFQFKDDYELPEGILKAPVTLEAGYNPLPAGVFVYSNGSAGWKLYSGQALPGDAQVTDLRPTITAEEIEKLMKPFMETSYVWGGVTDEGIDCSGFSQFFLRTAGVMLPRDAVQQATGGLIVAWGDDVAKKAKPGDLVFFAGGNGRVSHVAISLGGDRIIHSAGKGVHLSSLTDESDDHDNGRVLFARRILAR